MDLRGNDPKKRGVERSSRILFIIIVAIIVVLFVVFLVLRPNPGSGGT